MASGASEKSLLYDENALPLYDEETVLGWGRVLVITPHPDDESLGCGGVLALLAKYQQPAAVIFVSDGAASHPNSINFPPPVIASIRKTEALLATNILGVNAASVVFMGLPDGEIPDLNSKNFSDALSTLYTQIFLLKPNTILIPWCRDPHRDHQAVYNLAHHAVNNLPYFPRLLQYPIWARVEACATKLPYARDMDAWRVNITKVQSVKRCAILSYQSQLGNIVDDDPDGFTLEPHMLQPFFSPYEVFLESVNND